MRFVLGVMTCLTAMAAWAANESDPFVGRDLVVGDRARAAGVDRLLPLSCPPFYLRSEDGRIIDPVAEPGVSRPVSTRQTCGACHDYNRITQGYHFQAGYDERVLPSALGAAPPLHQSPGFYGKWQLLYQRELAPKVVDDPTSIDLTPFDWAVSCGICHPGGGPMEFDRAQRRYDDVQASDPAMAETADGDYYHARWNETGVMEADCFICHLEGYDYSSRVRQIKKGNYRWAATEAAGLGAVTGGVNDGQVPVVAYRAGLFLPDGRIHLAIQRPTDKACMACHDRSGVQKRGTAWHTHYMQDVHTERGMRCIDCHGGDIRHNFAKGDSASLTTRDDLDGTMQSCRDCHETGALGAPIAVHRGIPPLHFERLACTACHITRRPFAWAQAVDTLTGTVNELALSADETALGPRLFGAYWGTVESGQDDAAFTPLSSTQVRKAAAGSEDVAAILAEIQKTAPAGTQAVCLREGTAYGLSEGRLAPLPTRLHARRVGEIHEAPVACGVNPKTGLIEPETRQVGVFWGYLSDDGFRPLLLRDMAAAWQYLQGRKLVRHDAAGEHPLAVHDDNFDGVPEANTDAEIGLVAWALKQSLTRLPDVPLVYVKGAEVLRVDLAGDGPAQAAAPDEPYLEIRTDTARAYAPAFSVQLMPLAADAVPDECRPLVWGLGHGVEPLGQAPGRGVYGCRDCHAQASAFMNAEVVRDPFGPDGTPVREPAYRLMGLTPNQLRWGALREGGVKGLGHWILAAVLVLCGLHFVVVRMGAPFPRRAPLSAALRPSEIGLGLLALAAAALLGGSAVAFRLTGQTEVGLGVHTLHHWAGVAFAAVGFLLVLWLLPSIVTIGRGRFRAGHRAILLALVLAFVAMAGSGITILTTLHERTPYQQLMYLVHDAGALVFVCLLVVLIYNEFAVWVHRGGHVSGPQAAVVRATRED